jgi:hypothetical protein
VLCGKFACERFTVRLHFLCGDAGEACHFTRVRRENNSAASAVDLVAVFGQDVERVGVEDQGLRGFFDQSENEFLRFGT